MAFNTPQDDFVGFAVAQSASHRAKSCLALRYREER